MTRDKNAIFSKTKQFTAMMSIDDLYQVLTWALQRTHSWTLRMTVSVSKPRPLTNNKPLPMSRSKPRKNYTHEINANGVDLLLAPVNVSHL